MRNRRAFTLVELLMVVGIIALLVTIAMPSLGRAMWLARKTTCAANMGGAAKGLRMYMTENGGKYPNRGYGPQTTRFDEIGVDILDDDPPSANSNSRNLFLAVRTGHVVAEQLICPAVKGAEPASLENRDGLDVYDFEVAVDDNGTTKYVEKCSFSFHLQFTYRLNGPRGYPLTQTSENEMALLADKNPHVQYEENFFNGGIRAEPIDTAVEANSYNHRWNKKNEGQNVAYPDAHVKWWSTPQAGVDGDNIYTVWDGVDTTVGELRANSMPAGRTDSILVP